MDKIRTQKSNKNLLTQRYKKAVVLNEKKKYPKDICLVDENKNCVKAFENFMKTEKIFPINCVTVGKTTPKRILWNTYICAKEKQQQKYAKVSIIHSGGWCMYVCMCI